MTVVSLPSGTFGAGLPSAGRSKGRSREAVSAFMRGTWGTNTAILRERAPRRLGGAILSITRTVDRVRCCDPARPWVNSSASLPGGRPTTAVHHREHLDTVGVDTVVNHIGEAPQPRRTHVPPDDAVYLRHGA